MYTFGKRSNDNLETCHKDLQKIMRKAISVSVIDFGISEGYRSLERQQQLYREGKSKIDGVTRKGKHNYSPSQAVDIYVYHPEASIRRKLAYDKEHLSYIAGVVQSCARILYGEGEVNHVIRWGANWDSDGIIALDHSFDDYPHFEIIKP